MTLVCDFHVHLHSCFADDRLFDAAYDRCRAIAGNGQEPCEVALIIVDRFGTRTYSDICASRFPSRGWQVAAEKNRCSASLINGEAKLHIVQGWQGNTVERLEYIAIGTGEPPDEDRSLPETVAAIQRAGGIPVIPWGAGKWLGRRGRLLQSFISQGSGLFCLGDNGGRPYGWGESVHFQTARDRGIAILPGSDPLPLTRDRHRIGSYCGMLDGTNDMADIMMTITAAAAGTMPVRTAGSRISLYTFLRLQLSLRRSKRSPRACH